MPLQNVPSYKQKIYKQCIAEGLLDIFVDAGCAVNTPSCGPCMGGHMGVMAAGERCVSTPAVFKHNGACSLEEPQPKFLLATIISEDI